MVAACIRDDTGVGPAMASGSHTWKGHWALFPMAPMNTARPTHTPTSARAELLASTASSRSVKRNDPTVSPAMITPRNRPTSATLFTRKALMAAALLAWSSHQWPINRYEATPTSSQPTINWMVLGEETSTSMPPAKSEKAAKNQVKRTSPFMYPLA